MRSIYCYIPDTFRPQMHGICILPIVRIEQQIERRSVDRITVGDPANQISLTLPCHTQKYGNSIQFQRTYFQL